MRTSGDLPKTERDKRIKSLVDYFDGKEIGGRYYVTNLIAEGGMSFVFKARDASLNRDVVFKVFDGEFEGENDIDYAYDLYLKEGRIAASLKHPNIVTIHEILVLEDRPDRNPVLVMDFVEGKTLSSLVKENKLSFSQKLSVFLQLTSALEYAHTRTEPILHRDIKPSNVLVTVENRAVLIDFGLSRFLGSTLTTGLHLRGSDSYLAPELLVAYHHADAKAMQEATKPLADLFSLGATFYLALTGHTPFVGKALFDLMNSMLSAEVKPPSEINSEVPKELDEIVLSLLKPDPKERLQSATELKARLKEFVRQSQGMAENIEPAVVESQSPSEDSIYTNVLDDAKYLDVEELREKRQRKNQPKEEKGSSDPNKNVIQIPDGITYEEFAKKVASIQQNQPALDIVRKPMFIAIAALLCVVGLYSTLTSVKKSRGHSSSAEQGYGISDQEPDLPLPGGIADDTNSTESLHGGQSRLTGYSTSKRYSASQKRAKNADPNKAMKPKVEHYGNELVVFSRKQAKNQNIYGVPSGTVIGDLFLLNKIVSHNISSPVRAQLRVDFKLDGKEEVILPRTSVFVGEAKVIPSENRVFVEFSKVITPDHEEINISGLALMEDGSNGLVGHVKWPKGKNPIMQASTGVLSTAGNVAVSALSTDTVGDRVGKSIAGSSISSSKKILDGNRRPLPIITVNAQTPVQVYVAEGF